MVTAVDRASVRAEVATLTVRCPVAVVHPALVDQDWSWRTGTWIETVLEAPAARCTREYPASAFLANCAPVGGLLGAPRYTCGTTSPALLPVLVTLKLTVRPPSLATALSSPE